MNPEQLLKAPFNLSTDDLLWVTSTLDSLTTKEKVGQMFIPLCMDLGKESLDTFLNFKPGGIHRMAAKPVVQLRDSAEYLQKNSKVPLLLTSDLEFGHFSMDGGETSQFQNQLGTSASCHYIRDAERMARIAAREGAMMGFNWNFAPVVDINYNHRSHISCSRSFGSNPERVLGMGKAYINALQEEGMAACAKHWPGDGMDERDQHLVTTHNSLDMDKWRATYGKIYKNMIDSGVLTIMSAHITLAAYDKELNPDVETKNILPASISSNLNIKLLREELGFNGLIISDATAMGGLSSQGKRKEIVPQVINSGCDIFLFSRDDESDLKCLLEAVQDGTISEKRVNDAVLRILGLKASLGLHKKQKDVSLLPTKEESDKIIGCAEHKSWLKDVVSSSITLVKDVNNLLPINPEEKKRLLLISNTPVQILSPVKDLKFRDYLEDAGFEVTIMAEDIYPSPDFYDLVIYSLNQSIFFGQGSFFVNWPDLHKATMKSMIRTWDDIPTMMVSFANPYHLFDAPRVKTYINAYSTLDYIQKEVVKLITGESEFKGENPVDPFCGLEHAKI